MPNKLIDVESFMNRERLASFTTVDPKGRPHVVPVFFAYENCKVFVQTSRKSVKVRNLEVNNNVAVAVYQGEEAVIIRGKGQVIDSENQFVKKTQEHIDKYNLLINSRGRNSLGIPLFDKRVRCVIEIIPERTIFW